MRKLGNDKNRKMFGPERAPKYWCPFQIFPLQGEPILRPPVAVKGDRSSS